MVPKEFGKETRGSEDQKKNRDHPDNNIVKISFKTLKKPGDQ